MLPAMCRSRLSMAKTAVWQYVHLTSQDATMADTQSLATRSSDSQLALAWQHCCYFYFLPSFCPNTSATPQSITPKKLHYHRISLTGQNVSSHHRPMVECSKPCSPMFQCMNLINSANML
uniref:Uncharacterized protein n=1 Tax=Arundo donax TaxID=35708 RepID=A0A0A8YXS8_ARUDO